MTGLSDKVANKVGGGGGGVDAAGFDDFAREHYRDLVRFLRRRTASQQDAEDAAQESMARMLRYRGTELASAWKRLLYRVATNVAHDQFRAAKVHHEAQHQPLADHELAAPGRLPEEQALHEQQLMQIRQAIRELPPKCQRVYLLKRVHGMSHAQVAELCGISVKMVEKHLVKGLATLRRKVGDSVVGALK